MFVYLLYSSKEQYASVGDRSSHNSSSDSDCVSLQSEGLNIEAEKGLSLVSGELTL